MVILRHLHLPALTSYAHASHLQDLLVRRLLAYKASLPRASTTADLEKDIISPSSTTPPLPTILTFSSYPIYTSGRRETTPLSPEQLQYLTSPLETPNSPPTTATFTHTLRGGQTTFHGPGQLVIYPIISLAHPYSFAPNLTATLSTTTSSKTTRPASSLSPRTYVCLLEAATIATLSNYHIPSFRTVNPGVWTSPDTKIAALGVHLRRNVTSHGVGLNVSTNLRWFDRIVACGLEGKRVTSLRAELDRLRDAEGERELVQGSLGAEGKGMRMELELEDIATAWVRAFAKEVGGDEVQVVRVTEAEIEDNETGKNSF